MKLSRLLTLNTIDINHILNVLFYLHKLDDNNISKLPNELIIEILSNLDNDNIKLMCESSKKIKNICKSQEGKDLIISRLKDDSLDISTFTFEELLFYSKILPFKGKLGFKPLLNEIFVLKDNKLIYFTENIMLYTKIIRDDVNQVVQYSTDIVILLTDNGKLYSYDIITKEQHEIAIINKVIGIFPVSINHIHIVTADGNNYEYYNGILDKIKKLNRIVQMNFNNCLSDKGEVYIITQLEGLRFEENISESIKSNGRLYHKIANLPKIKQITNEGYVLSSDNIIYFLNANHSTTTIYSAIDNIKQISVVLKRAYAEKLIILYENGDVYTIVIDINRTFLLYMKNYELSNIGEITITYIKDQLHAALSNNNILYVRRPLYVYPYSTYDLNDY